MFASTLWSQGIQIKSVRDFSGGLVNSLSNPLMKDNQSLVLENYDVTDIGGLKRRPGMSLFYEDAYTGTNTDYVIPFHNPDYKQLLTVRQQINGYFDLDTAEAWVQQITLCNAALEVCTTSVFAGYLSVSRNYNEPSNLDKATMNNELIIGGSKSEMVIWDGEEVSPVRPLSPGEPRIAILDGGGNVQGRFEWGYSYFDIGVDTSAVSPASIQIEVTSGKVLIYDLIAPTDAAVDSIFIYRRIPTPFASWHKIAEIDEDQNYYLDNTSNNDVVDVLDSVVWSFRQECEDDASNDCASSADLTAIIPPGGWDFSVGVRAEPDSGINNYPCQINGNCNELAYQMIYLDSATGRRSLSSPTICVEVADTYGAKEVDFTNLPTPSASQPNINKKILIRNEATYFFTQAARYDSDNDTTTCASFQFDSLYAQGYDYWFILDTLDAATTTYTDSLNGVTLSVLAKEYNEDDSLLTFRPVSFAIHNSRLYAVGDPANPNTVYYSAFGRPSTWPFDKFLNIPSQQGDWFVRVIEVGGRLVLFRQNSISQLTGTSFYQFTVDELSNNVGLAAPKTLAYSGENVFFSHSTGVYILGKFGGVSNVPISTPISNTVDSVGINIQRAVGKNIGREYWYSILIDSDSSYWMADTAAINDSSDCTSGLGANCDSITFNENNDKTYIYSETPLPHWKCYDFGINDATLFDDDTTITDFRTQRWIIAKDNDSLYRWNYSDTDTLDDTTHVIATYQSKYFFDDNIREKILYLDIYGDGTSDSLLVTFYDKKDGAKAGTVVKIDTLYTDFTNGLKDRIYLDNLVTRLSIKIQDFGEGNYTITGYDIGYIPWDEGITQ